MPTFTTTLLNDETIEYISDNYSKLSVSIDGVREAHNLNRIFKDGTGSYDKVIDNIKRLLTKRSDLKARLTINPQNVSFLFDITSCFAASVLISKSLPISVALLRLS